MAVFFESLLDMLESYGVFTLLAYLLLLILLYYLFKHVLERGVKRLSRTMIKKPSRLAPIFRR